MLGGAGVRSWRNETTRLKLMGELESGHLSNVVSCHGRVVAGLGSA